MDTVCSFAGDSSGSSMSSSFGSSGFHVGGGDKSGEDRVSVNFEVEKVRFYVISLSCSI